MSLTTTCIIVHDMFTVRTHTHIYSTWLALSVGYMLGLECVYNTASNMNTLCDSARVKPNNMLLCSLLCSVTPQRCTVRLVL